MIGELINGRYRIECEAGSGGMAYGMRTIFPMIKLIDDVEKYAKKDYWMKSSA